MLNNLPSLRRSENRLHAETQVRSDTKRRERNAPRRDDLARAAYYYALAGPFGCDDLRLIPTASPPGTPSVASGGSWHVRPAFRMRSGTWMRGPVPSRKPRMRAPISTMPEPQQLTHKLRLRRATRAAQSANHARWRRFASPIEA